MKITNTQKGPRGVNTVAGPVLVEPGETVEAKVYAREREHIEATGWFDIQGQYTPDPDKPAATKDVGLSDEAKASIAALSGEVTSLRDQIAQMQDDAGKKALADRDARIAELEAQLAAKADAAKTDAAKDASKGAK